MKKIARLYRPNYNEEELFYINIEENRINFNPKYDSVGGIAKTVEYTLTDNGNGLIFRDHHCKKNIKIDYSQAEILFCILQIHYGKNRPQHLKFETFTKD